MKLFTQVALLTICMFTPLFAGVDNYAKYSDWELVSANYEELEVVSSGSYFEVVNGFGTMMFQKVKNWGGVNTLVFTNTTMSGECFYTDVPEDDEDYDPEVEDTEFTTYFGDLRCDSVYDLQYEVDIVLAKEKKNGNTNVKEWHATMEHVLEYSAGPSANMVVECEKTGEIINSFIHGQLFNKKGNPVTRKEDGVKYDLIFHITEPEDEDSEEGSGIAICPVVRD